jgi:hypothetical protein
MSARGAPEWLADFQARFGAVLRTPLDRSTGTLRARPDRYDARALAAALDGPSLLAGERLAVYNRQYWFRLLTVMQNDFPLCSRLLGLWLWNDYSARFLAAHPPQHHDIHRVSRGFNQALEAMLTRDSIARGPRLVALPRRALMQAARIDMAFRDVFMAPDSPPFQLTPEQARELAVSRLRPSPCWAIVEEDWPLLQLRHELAGDESETAIALPAAWPATRSWALLRTPSGVARMPLEVEQARLLGALCLDDVATALARVEVACPQTERDTLPQRTQQWLAESVSLGFFCGIAND